MSLIKIPTMLFPAENSDYISDIFFLSYKKGGEYNDQTN